MIYIVQKYALQTIDSNVFNISLNFVHLISFMFPQVFYISYFRTRLAYHTLHYLALRDVGYCYLGRGLTRTIKLSVHVNEILVRVCR